MEQRLKGTQFGFWQTLEDITGTTVAADFVQCRCRCGHIQLIKVWNLVSGDSRGCRSCRAKNRDHQPVKHGWSGTPTYVSYYRMKNRCTNPNAGKDYAKYGGRGITICDRWMESFEHFLEDMGPRPSLKHSLDRYPNRNGNYEPGNCRWATSKEQSYNSRTPVWVTINGETHTQTEWAKLSGLSLSTISIRRLAGITGRALIQPPTRGNKRPKDTKG